MDTPSPLDEDWTPERLQSLLDSQVPEDFRLEYKGLEALPVPCVQKDRWDKIRMEIGKDATAFANSDGGVIIYGIKEKRVDDGRPIPEKFQPVSMAEFSRDQLSQIIASNSEPRLPGVRALPIPVPNQADPSQVCFVVLIPKSDTAHQASDGKYYYRNEATTAFMRDWQVRDAMNRRKVPKLSLDVRKKWSVTTGNLPVLKLLVSFENNSLATARLYRFSVCWPRRLKGSEVSCDACSLNGRVMMRSKDAIYTVEESSFGPFYPGMGLLIQCIITGKLGQAELTDDADLLITMFVDDVPSRIEIMPIASLELLP